jgi:hypothetical protein
VVADAPEDAALAAASTAPEIGVIERAEGKSQQRQRSAKDHRDEDMRVHGRSIGQLHQAFQVQQLTTVSASG